MLIAKVETCPTCVLVPWAICRHFLTSFPFVSVTWNSTQSPAWLFLLLILCSEDLLNVWYWRGPPSKTVISFLGIEDQFCCWMNNTVIVIIHQDYHCDARTLWFIREIGWPSSWLIQEGVRMHSDCTGHHQLLHLAFNQTAEDTADLQ